MNRLTIYSGPLSMFGAKVQIAALEKQLDFELIMVPYDSRQGYSPKHPEVLRINPKRQVPVLVHGDLEIFDSTQIFEYLEDLRPEPALWPRAPAARARARGLERVARGWLFLCGYRFLHGRVVWRTTRCAGDGGNAASARVAGAHDTARAGANRGRRNGTVAEGRRTPGSRLHGVCWFGPLGLDLAALQLSDSAYTKA
jgi:glutathione S-transferase